MTVVEMVAGEEVHLSEIQPGYLFCLVGNEEIYANSRENRVLQTHGDPCDLRVIRLADFRTMLMPPTTLVFPVVRLSCTFHNA